MESYFIDVGWRRELANMAMAAVAIFSLVSTGAGVYMQAQAARQQAEAANQAAEYNAKIQERNAEIAEMQAVSAEERGVEAERLHREKVSGLKGRQRVSAAASGVLVDEGSPLAILQDTAVQGEMDALTIRRNSAQEVWGFRTQAGGYTAQAGLSRAQKQDPGMAFTTTLVSGAGRLGSQYLDYRGTGVL